METTIATWEDQLASIWASIDDVEPNEFLAAIDAHLADLPVGSAIGAFEAAASRDSTGHSDQAVPFYRYALDIGLEGERRRRAVIQLASSLRNLGQIDESLRLLETELALVEGTATTEGTTTTEGTATTEGDEAIVDEPIVEEAVADEAPVDDAAAEPSSTDSDDSNDSNHSDDSDDSDDSGSEPEIEDANTAESKADETPEVSEPNADETTDAPPAVVDDYLVDELRAFLALCLIDVGREREAAIITLRTLAPHLSRYQRSLANYASALAKPGDASSTPA